jgi:hypothetical protein
MNRYEKLADNIAQRIRAGSLKANDRLPSVRELKSQMGISASTVFSAYYPLEAQGLVEARQRSGYFVRARAEVPANELAASEPVLRSMSVDVSSLVFQVQWVRSADRSDEAVENGRRWPARRGPYGRRRVVSVAMTDRVHVVRFFGPNGQQTRSLISSMTATLACGHGLAECLAYRTLLDANERKTRPALDSGSGLSTRHCALAADRHVAEFHAWMVEGSL